MAKVICTLPNASSSISGVKFVSHKNGMISEEVEDEVALHFASINGYQIHDPKAGKQTGKGGKVVDPGTQPGGSDEDSSSGSDLLTTGGGNQNPAS